MKTLRLLAIFSALALICSFLSGPPVTAAPLTPNAGSFSLAFSGGPSYDSGWLDIADGVTLTLTHNLDGTNNNLLVDLQARKLSSALGVNNRFTGGIDFGASPYAGSADDRMGVFWHNLSADTIKVTRQAEDTLVSQVRICIWKTSEVDYISGWASINPGGTLTFNYYLPGATADETVVNLMFLDASDGWGVNQRAGGGRDLGARSGYNNARVGAYWFNLTTYSVSVFRREDDFLADQVLVRIWRRPQPTYDSGWITFAAGETRVLSHDIKGATDDMLVDMQYRSTNAPAYGVNHSYWGGNDFGANPPAGLAANDRVGAYWYGLTYNSIAIVRRQEDIYANQVRVRIWNFWTPTRPAYDSGWRAVSQGAFLNLTHGIPGTKHNCMVDLQFKSTTAPTYGINNIAYGGLDTLGSGDRYGAYWFAFSIPTVSVRRREEDIFADLVRLRIWDMPEAAYDSKFIGIAPGQTLTLYHNLNGLPADYLVDLQFMNTAESSNASLQKGYGGLDLGGADANDNKRMGAAWHNLTSNTIQVTRGEEDIYLNSMRVRIWLVSQPDYHSGWVGMTPYIPNTLNHNLGHTPEDYFVNVMFDGPSSQVNHQYYGTNYLGDNAGSAKNSYVGATWRALTNNSITLFRAGEDTYAQLMQTRIWVIHQQVFLPILKK